MYQGKYEKKEPSQRTAPAASRADAPQTRQAAPRPAASEVPEKTPRQSARRPAPMRRAKKGTVVFYTVYLSCILLFFIALACVMTPLREWLTTYEASQPGYKRDQVFTELFADANWARVYTLAGLEGNAFENQDTFCAYMDKLVGDQELTCLETSAGLSGDKKYIVRLGEKKLASFTLTGGADSQTEIPQWVLGSVEVLFAGTESVTVEKLPSQTVYINGVALDDSYTIRTVSTLAENYLPAGVHGFQLEQQQVTGLLTEPVVSVRDSAGNEIPVTRNEATGVYTQEFSAAEASAEEKELALNATKTYALYMIGKATLGDVQKLFNTNSQFYETIRRSEVGWAQTGSSYEFTDPVYSDYYRYSDTLFSIRLDAALNQTRFDGSVKSNTLNNTLFFEKNEQGKWMVMEATNIGVQETQEQVRLTFLNADTVLSSLWVQADATSVTLPAVTAPEGQVFKGWVRQDDDGNGRITLTVVFEPTDSNVVCLPAGNTLEPMTLHALFEEADAE